MAAKADADTGRGFIDDEMPDTGAPQDFETDEPENPAAGLMAQQEPPAAGKNDAEAEE